MTLAHSLVKLTPAAEPLTHASLVGALTARFPGDMLPRVLGSQIGATLCVRTPRHHRTCPPPPRTPPTPSPLERASE
jgi:hypothetical protein